MAAGLGSKTFTTGEVLTAADVNGYLMQGVLVFASAVARDAAITSPQEGQYAFLKDTDVTYYYDGAAWIVSGATGDITAVTAGTGISGGGASGDVTISVSAAVAAPALVANTADSYGYIGTPQVSTAVDIAIVASHMGKQIYFTVTGKVATIPANGTIAIGIGASFTVVNDTGVTSTIGITTDTLILANSATTGTRTLAAYGVAVFTKVTATKWIASGNGLT